MKRILVISLILLIVLFLLYCAELDGMIHISAMAFNKCEFCQYVEEHDLEEDTKLFPQNVLGSMKSIDYELVLYDHLVHGHDRVARQALKYNIHLSYCPECGRRITK